jgi:hypothetical protein
MNRMKASVAALGGSILALALLHIPAQAQRWVPGNGQSCDNACADVDRSPVISGTYTLNGNPFYVCRGNADNAGRRPGWNLEPGYATSCSVASSNQEQRITPYDCLCSGTRR